MSVVTQIQVRRGTASQWTSANPTLASGEWGYETDTNKAKIGNGSTAWNSLAYGSITGTLADGSVTSAKLANTAVAAGSYTATNITVNAKGQITAASNGTGFDAFDDQVFLATQIWS